MQTHSPNFASKDTVSSHTSYKSSRYININSRYTKMFLYRNFYFTHTMPKCCIHKQPHNSSELYFTEIRVKYVCEHGNYCKATTKHKTLPFDHRRKVLPLTNDRTLWHKIYFVWIHAASQIGTMRVRQHRCTDCVGKRQNQLYELQQDYGAQSPC